MDGIGSMSPNDRNCQAPRKSTVAIRTGARAVAIGTVALAWHFSAIAGKASCSYMATYPSAIGHHTFMLATATAGTVTVPLDTTHVYGTRTALGQVMAIADVAGYQTDEIRRGLRASGGNAVFVRYGIGPGCGPFPARDGALDSVGVNGLYVGHPRPADRWVFGRPTFDIFRAAHFPLPQRLSSPSGHLVITMQDTSPTMTAVELFRMYQSLWADSVSVRDTSLERRIRRWLEASPQTARKQPASEVATSMLSAATEAMIAAHPIPFGGTFAITVIVPGIDSVVMYGQTSHRMRPWLSDVVRDSVTSVPVAILPRSFALDVTTAAALENFERSSMGINPCSPIPIIVSELPIVPDADSTWRGEMWPSGFLECMSAESKLGKLTRPENIRTIASGPASVIFRRHRDGRVSFEAATTTDASPGILIRGERISKVTYGSP
jgi:hypothetical protein